jgi:HlyD family secretion protein
MRGWRGWLIGSVVILALVVGASQLFRPRPIEVQWAPVDTGAVEDVIANSEGGTVRSRSQARLGAERAGRIERIVFREGASVPRGAVLLKLDSSTEETRLDAARRDLDALHAAHEAAHAAELLARQNLARSDPLYRQGMISVEAIDAARSRLETASAELRAAEARRAAAVSAVRLARDEIAHRLIRAPFSGVIARRFVEVGEPVVPGQAVLELISLEQLYVSAPIDERDAGRLIRGLPARVTLDAYPGVEWPAMVTRIAPVVETVKEQNRTLEVELDLPADPARPTARPGMTADVEIVLARREGVIRVPSIALLEGGSVLVAEKGRASVRRIRVGLRNWQWTEILAGVAAGERVITSLDRVGLKNGVAVTLAPGRFDGEPAADSAATAAVK